MTDYVVDGPSASRAVRTDARGSARRPARPRGGGWSILVASEATLFGAFVGTYFYLRFKTAHLAARGIPSRLVVPLILSPACVATSLPMQLASQAARAGRLGADAPPRRSSRSSSSPATSPTRCTTTSTSSTHRTSRRDAYSSIYYTLLGADHAHVLVGALFSLWLLAKLARGLTTYRVNAVQAITFYWHAVNVITLVVIGTLLSAARMSLRRLEISAVVRPPRRGAGLGGAARRRLRHHRGRVRRAAASTGESATTSGKGR